MLALSTFHAEMKDDEQACINADKAEKVSSTHLSSLTAEGLLSQIQVCLSKSVFLTME